ncbi:hypothetical protein [Nocardioides marmoraquaticus]
MPLTDDDREYLKHCRSETVRCDNAILRLGTAPVDPDLSPSDTVEAERVRDLRIDELRKERDLWAQLASELGRRR